MRVKQNGNFDQSLWLGYGPSPFVYDHPKLSSILPYENAARINADI